MNSLSSVGVFYLIIASIIGVSRSAPSEAGTNGAARALEGQHVNGNSVVDITIFYESLCYDSIMFIRDQLVPTYRRLGAYMNVSYVPYGKASQQKVSDGYGGEKWQFSCQHGSQECYGNKAQACGIARIVESRPSSGVQTDLVNFVGCVMSSSNPSTAVPGCLDVAGLDSEAKSSVSRCISSNESDELLARYGDETHNLQPTITFVPTIVINRVFSHDNQAAALRNLTGLICRNLSAQDRPTTCNG